MAYAHIGITRITGARLGARLHDLRIAASRYAARRAAYRRTFDELASLTDRELADLSIARADIRRIAREAGDQA